VKHRRHHLAHLEILVCLRLYLLHPIPVIVTGNTYPGRGREGGPAGYFASMRRSSPSSHRASISPVIRTRSMSAPLLMNPMPTRPSLNAVLSPESSPRFTVNLSLFPSRDREAVLGEFFTSWMPVPPWATRAASAFSPSPTGIRKIASVDCPPPMGRSATARNPERFPSAWTNTPTAPSPIGRRD